eukprot:CAMPEP_0181382610 /NCGR_PEP_ID=MMETSP1106-20121128/20847_1 /TAXON_ID=81844 /ORGANISM="Mantoniella antarctica, Strain SL-175" /LENGTH=34 /DNA_ID= /DNA_START= /DNA_END= /DNA_ORIENTATION=
MAAASSSSKSEPKQSSHIGLALFGRFSANHWIMS